tara:strand:+ start:4950 stop:6785 length:1836 start_codon:yes stop_codon:yes gene_type:complete
MLHRVTRNTGNDFRDGLTVIVRAILEHRWLLAGLFLFNLLAAVFEGGTMGLLALAVSALIQKKSISELFSWSDELGGILHGWFPEIGSGGLFLVLVLVAVIAQLIKSVMTYVGKRLAIRLQFKTSMQLQAQSTDQIMSYSFSEVTKTAVGVLGGLIDETARISSIVGLVNRTILAVVMFASYLVMMFVFSVPLALSALVIVIAIGFGISRITEKLKTLGRLVVDGGILTNKLSVEFLNAPRLLRVFSVTEIAGRMINSARNKSLQAQERSAVLRALVDPAIDALTITAAGGFLVVGYLISGEEALSVIPKLLLFLLILNRMMPQAKAINEVRMGFANSIHGIAVVGRFLRSCDKSFERIGGNAFNRLANDISFENVSFRYDGSQGNVLTDINFSVTRSQTVAIVGESGSGKSTIASLVLALYEPTVGAIRVDGKNLRSLKLRDWRDSIGVVDQDVFLLNASIKENISFATEKYSSEEIVQAAKLAHADEFIRELPEGYDTIIGDRGLRLSGGQQQRLALARALVRQPQILILDEATSALDSQSERMIQQTIEQLHTNMTMIVIAHRLSTIVKADQIVVMGEGQIIEQGTFNELANNEGPFQGLWELQLGER